MCRTYGCVCEDLYNNLLTDMLVDLQLCSPLTSPLRVMSEAVPSHSLDMWVQAFTACNSVVVVRLMNVLVMLTTDSSGKAGAVPACP